MQGATGPARSLHHPSTRPGDQDEEEEEEEGPPHDHHGPGHEAGGAVLSVILFIYLLSLSFNDNLFRAVNKIGISEGIGVEGDRDLGAGVVPARAISVEPADTSELDQDSSGASC